jgi:hypothetical protein
MRSVRRGCAVKLHNAEPGAPLADQWGRMRNRGPLRRGRTLRLTGPERTLVDGFAAPWWVGGLDELVESAAGFRDLDLDLLDAYLELFDRRVLDAATGWFLERHPEVSTGVSRLLVRLENRPRRLEAGQTEPESVRASAAS